MNMEGVHHFRDRFNVPVADADIEKLPYITFDKESEEYKYLHERRQALKGYVPTRLPEFTQKLEMPALEDFSSLLEEQNKEISTTIAFVRALNVMLKNKSIKRSPGANHRRRSAYLRYGRSVPSDRYLQPERPAVHSAGP